MRNTTLITLALLLLLTSCGKDKTSSTTDMGVGGMADAMVAGSESGEMAGMTAGESAGETAGAEG